MRIFRGIFSMAAVAVIAISLPSAASAQQQQAGFDWNSEDLKTVWPKFQLTDIKSLIVSMGGTGEIVANADNSASLNASFGNSINVRIDTFCGDKGCDGMRMVTNMHYPNIDMATLQATATSYQDKNPYIQLIVKNQRIYIVRYESALYGIPKGNVAASFQSYAYHIMQLREQLNGGS